MDGTKLNNPKDPILQIPKNAQELFKSLGSLCTGFTGEDVNTAVGNILVNSIRQTYATRPEAEARWDELVGKLKGILMEHYDPATNKRRNIFPHTQVIRPELYIQE